MSITHWAPGCMQSARTWPWSAAKQARTGNTPSTVSGPLSDSPTPGEPRFRSLWDPLTADPKARGVGLACKGGRRASGGARMGSSRASGAPAGPCTLENPWRGPQGLQALSRASAQTWGRTACGSWRPTTSVTSSCTCRAPGTGRPHKCWRSTVLRPVPGEVRGWPGHPHSSPWHRGAGGPLVQVPHTCPSFPSPPLPTRPQTSVHRTVPRAEVQLPGQIRQSLQITRTWPRKDHPLQQPG